MVLSSWTSGLGHFTETPRLTEGAGDMAIRHVLAIGLPTALQRPEGTTR